MEEGVTIFGYFKSEKGLGAATRRVLQCIKLNGIPCSIWNIDDPSSENREFKTHTASQNQKYKVGIFNFWHDALSQGFTFTHENVLAPIVYRVGYWNWELDTIPDEWLHSFCFYDEIWVPSTFNKTAFEKKSPLPVYCIPYGIELPSIPTHFQRSYFGLDEKKMLFLFSFDAHSTYARKNPEAVVIAFKQAFSDQDHVQLVIKMTHGDPSSLEFQSLAKLCASHPQIKLINKVLPTEENLGLMQSCDVFVSLHRSEGFGFNLCEAMAMAKPVIATGYSGNLDYMDHANSYLVDYDLVELDSNVGPYKKGERWAEPNIQHAATLMKHVYENPEEAKKKGKNGKESIETQLSMARMGSMISDRLEKIYLEMDQIELKKSQFQITRNLTNVYLYQIESRIPIFGFILVAAKKVVRWFIKPFLFKQSTLNNIQMTKISELERKLAELEKRVSEKDTVLK